MKQFKVRLDGLSAEKRDLLRQMLESKGLRFSADESEGAGEKNEAAMAAVLKKVAVKKAHYGSADQSDKQNIQQTYNAYHDQLRSAIFHEHSFFMNLGYVANDARQHARIKLPEHMISRNYVRLALEVIGDCDLTGKRLLDVGCGRGGTVYTAHTYFQPRETVGLDLAAGAIEFCAARHRYPNTRFLRGDAENLPFADGSYDVVTNIESSHHYAKIEMFYRGVYRVLSGGGYFLYTTMLPVERFEKDRATLAGLGFVLEREQDITRNVLAACDQDKGTVFGGLVSAAQDPWIANAVSLPGSDTYNNMKAGKTAYRIFKLRKPG